ncbi:MAG TPA: Omp28-related outer membrane protein, partial [Saprospiraceae bacterium]|nr:Omp28-related outer membrane protein [Saprospiraceae bacterium]
MKHKLFFPLLAAVAISACKEVPITIPELSVGDRKVLAEELTGVRCPNCPDGTATLVSLSEQLGDNLVVVSIHAAPGYDTPYPESHYDFRTADGTAMANFIGSAAFFPTAAINRRLVPPETEPYLPRAIWSGIISEELDKPPVVGLFVNTEFDDLGRKLDIEVTIAPEATLYGEHRLTVLITQDSIVDYQKKGLEKIPDYTHRHVLRDVLTQPSGDVLEEALTSTSAITKKFSLTLPADWDEKHCSVVAFVHHGTSPDKEVLQVEEVHV